MNKDTFGDSLKREREMRGVTLEEVSGATRIATRFLKAIEEEQWDQLPGGVFNRGFVRAVARYLGLDEENTVAEYTLAVGDRQPVPVWTGSPPAVTADQPWLAWIIAGAVVAALALGAWFGTRKFLLRRAQKRAAQTSILDTPSPFYSSAASTAASQPSTNVPSTPVGVNLRPDAQSAASGSIPSETNAASSSPADSSAASPGASDRFELKVMSGKRTKVVVVADKDVVFDGTMKPGENHFFNATDHFQVSAKDAGVVHLELNGKTLAPIGPAGHQGKITLTREGLKADPGGAN